VSEILSIYHHIVQNGTKTEKFHERSEWSE